MTARYLFLSLTLAATGLLFACAGQDEAAGGDAAALEATVVVDKLMNPSGVTFSPGGELTVCDSGHGRVVVVRDGRVEDYITGFDTEYWKVDPKGKNNRFKLGPLSALWLGETLVVSDGGKKDGQETLLFFKGPGSADQGEASSTCVPRGVEASKGEGNLTGLCASGDGRTLYLCGQGSDARTWVISCDVATKKLVPFASADDHGISVNSPMQALVWDAESILVLYSGKGGADDGLIVKWNRKTAQPMGQWALEGLTDPMGMARVPGSDDLVVVDNNWSLTEVKEGRLARVSLGGEGKAEVTMLKLASGSLRGPVSCTFGPDGALYVAQLGTMFDQELGQVVKITGIK